MNGRLSVLCGALFAAGAFAAGAATLAAMPQQAMDDLRRHLTICALPGLGCAPLGVFLHQRTVGTPVDSALGIPDPGTVVSEAWIDLSRGPVRLDLPATGARFFAVQALDGDGERIALATATTFGTNGGALRFAGPNDASGAGPVLQPRTDWVWIIARFAVADDADMPAVQALQAGLRITQEARP